MIKIAISGATGKMGKNIIQAASDNVNVITKVTLNKNDNIIDFINEFDVLIDFSRPSATLQYLKACVKYNKKVVIGTTGFNNNELQQLTEYSKKIAIVFAPNMSIGINLILKLLETTAKVIGSESDIEIIEAHHRYKVDAPSGTALKMGEVIANALGRDLKQCAIYGRKGVEKVRDKNTIAFSTIRGGDTVGEHTAYFFMDGERIEITHKASSRMTFANGAIRASIWLNDKKFGLYSMQEVLEL